MGGADIRSISAEHYHRLVAYVSQDNFLFDNTVRENIRMGRPDTTDAEVEQAAKDCGCYEFITGLENGFDTVVGSGGGHLSGVSTRVVMLVTEGIFSTAVMTLAMFLFDWRVGLLTIAGLLIYYFVNHALQRRSEKTTNRKLAGDTAVVEQVLEFIKGIAEVKSYSLTGKYNRRLESAMDISGAELTPEHHDLHAENIHFSYGEKPIINGITLDIPERTTTAIVGPSGGGKTTLCHLLSRFWDVDSGRVTLGCHDVREYDMDSLMQNFSFVFQNVYLFHDTIANNIRFGQPDAPMEKVVEAAMKNSPIIILDEATA